jgi:hypothetical protein
VPHMRWGGQLKRVGDVSGLLKLSVCRGEYREDGWLVACGGRLQSPSGPGRGSGDLAPLPHGQVTGSFIANRLTSLASLVRVTDWTCEHGVGEVFGIDLALLIDGL